MRLRSKSKTEESTSGISIKLILTSALVPSLFLAYRFQWFGQHHDSDTITKKPASTGNETQQFVWSRKLKEWSLATHKLDKDTGQRNQEHLCVWPDQCQASRSDRIVDQLQLERQADDKIFKIFIDGRESTLFEGEHCHVNRCQITDNRSQADALIFHNSDVPNPNSLDLHRSKQVWIAYLLESPLSTFDRRFQRLNRGNHVFNWTASYRSDSDIVTPYSKFVPFESQADNWLQALRLANIKRKTMLTPDDYVRHFVDQKYALANERHKKLIESKRGRVAWFASNCHAKNNRLELAKELSQYIQVDIYGRCGNLTCEKWNHTGCFQKVNNEYKFYLAFENSNCRQYITEKLYRNSYHYNDPNHLVLPIVFGAKRSDYEAFAPPDSFLHVDDFDSIEDLATYLKHLDRDDALFYSYFNWKSLGRFIDTKFMCRVCALLHDSHLSGRVKSYSSIEDWWNNYLDPDSPMLSPSCKV